MDDIERKLRDLGERTARDAAYRAAPAGRIVRRARLRRALTMAAPVAAVVLFAAVAYPRLDLPEGRGMRISVDLAAAAEATERTGSARIELSTSMELDGRTYAMEGEGQIDFDDFRSYFRMTEDGDFAAFGDVEMISIGRVLYQRPVGESKWVKTKVDTRAGAASFATGPDEFLSYLESVSEDVTSLGREVLDGVPVTHLRATLDASALDDGASTAGTEFDPFDVWIDDANRVRKMAFSASFDGADASSPGTMRMTMRFWDFGLPVDVAAPPPEDVTDEPPSSWGDTGMDYSVTTKGSPQAVNEFGIGEFFTVAGEDGLSGPHAIVTITESHVTVCIQGELPATSGSSIVEIESGDVVVSVPGDEKETNRYARGGCRHPNESTDLADRLRDDPELFELRIERAEAPDLVVPLTQTFEG